MNMQAKLQAIDTSSFLMQNQNDNESLRSAESYSKLHSYTNMEW